MSLHLYRGFVRPSRITFSVNIYILLFPPSENKRLHENVHLVRTEEQLRRRVNKPSFKNLIILSPNLALVRSQKTRVILDKPIFLAGQILDHSKRHMTAFFYNMLMPSFHAPPVSYLNVLLSDTDSFAFSVKYPTSQGCIFVDLGKCASAIDTSAYEPSHPYFHVSHENPEQVMRCHRENGSRLGIFKDEMGRSVITHLISLSPKLYSYTYVTPTYQSGQVVEYEEKSTQKCKGLARATIRNNVRHQDYIDVLDTTKPKRFSMRLITSQNHVLYLLEIEKTGLGLHDTKRFWISKYDSVPFGFMR